MFIFNYVGIGLLGLACAVGFGLLGHCLYLYNSLLSILFTWLLLTGAIFGGLLLRIVALPDRAAATLRHISDLLVVLGAVAGIVIALGVFGFHDIRDVSSLWALFAGGLLFGAASTLIASRISRRSGTPLSASLPRS